MIKVGLDPYHPSPEGIRDKEISCFILVITVKEEGAKCGGEKNTNDGILL